MAQIFMWSMLWQADHVFAVSSLATLWVANGPDLYAEHAVTGWPNLCCVFTVHIVGSQWPKSLCGACCDRLTISLLYLHCPHCGYPMAQIFMWSMLWQADHVFAVSSLSTLGKASGPIFMWSMLSQADQVFAVSSLSTLWVSNGPNLYVEHAVTGWPFLCCIFTVHTVGSQWSKSLCGACCDRLTKICCIFTVHNVGSQCPTSLCGACCDRLTMSLWSSLSTLWVASGPNLYLEHAKTGRSCLCCIFTVHTVGSQ